MDISSLNLSTLSKCDNREVQIRTKSKFLSLKGFKFLYSKHKDNSLYNVMHTDFRYVDFMISTLHSIYIKCKTRLSEEDQVKICFLQYKLSDYLERKNQKLTYDRNFLFTKNEFAALSYKYKYELESFYKGFFRERNIIKKYS